MCFAIGFWMKMFIQKIWMNKIRQFVILANPTHCGFERHSGALTLAVTNLRSQPTDSPALISAENWGDHNYFLLILGKIMI